MEPFSRGIIAEVNNQAAKGERRRVRDTLVVTMVSGTQPRVLLRRRCNAVCSRRYALVTA